MGCSNGCSPNGSTNDAGYDERSRSNSTWACRRSSSKSCNGCSKPTSGYRSSNHNLQYLFKGRNHLQHLCWLLHPHKNKSRCWVNACSLLSKECILNWQERLLACYWRLTILNWYLCWKTDSLSKERWMRPLLFFKLINPNPMNNYNEKRHQIRGLSLTRFQKIVHKRNF